MQKQPRIVTARSPRRTPRHRDEHIRLAFPQRSMCSRETPPHLQPFAPRPSPQDEMMDIQGLPAV